MNNVHRMWMGTRERRDELREALVAAAEMTISSGGLTQIKARDLAAKAGCAVGAIYNVFPDLDALILEVNARTLAVAAAEITDPKGGDPVEALVHLALAYLDFAAANQPRWRAVFDHRMAGGRPIPDWYAELQQRLFVRVEKPLSRLRGDLAPADNARLARTLFSAVHGVVSLGLDEKLEAIPAAVLREQVAGLVRAAAAGLAVERAPAAKRRAPKSRG